MYWGYKLRYAPNISSVFKNCPYKVFSRLSFILPREFSLNVHYTELSFLLIGRIWSSDRHIWTRVDYKFFGAYSTIIQAPFNCFWWPRWAGRVCRRRCRFEGMSFTNFSTFSISRLGTSPFVHNLMHLCLILGQKCDWYIWLLFKYLPSSRKPNHTYRGK